MALTERDLGVITDAKVIAATDDLPRSDWLNLRRQGLGGSDAAATLGLSRWTSPYELWLDKTGRQFDDENDGASLAARTGHALEQHVIAEAERHMPEIHVDRAPYMLKHPEHPNLLADVDGIASSDKRRTRGLFEAKTAEVWMAGQWADGVPAYYEAQVAHYLAVTGFQWAVVAVLIGFTRLETYTIERNDEIVGQLVAHELAWWQRHVVEGEPPAVDGSKATTEALKLIEAKAGATTTLAEVTTFDPYEVFEQLAECKRRIAVYEAEAATCKNQLRQAMGEHTELVDDAGRTWATWRSSKDRTVVDVDGALQDAARGLGITVDELLARHTTTKPGPRTLRTDPGVKLAATATADEEAA